MQPFRLSDLEKEFPILLSSGPCFSHDSSNIEFIYSPIEFYTKMLHYIRTSKRAIFSALYIGEDLMEQNMCNEIEKRLKDTESESPFTIQILIDGNRKERGGMKHLERLVNLYSGKIVVNLYSPESNDRLSRLFKAKIFKEMLGVHHMKIYIFDDDVIVSGANLSEIYFKNRLDRYVLIKDSCEISGYFEDLISVVTNLSNLTSRCSQILHMKEFLHKYSYREKVWKEGKDTLLMPLLQMPIFDINQDKTYCKGLFEFITGKENKRFCMTLSTAYFNIPKDLASILLTSEQTVEVVTSSRESNGFNTAGRMAKLVCIIYSAIAYDFAKKSNTNVRVRMYKKRGWTFHSKGIWLTDKADNLPFMTAVGSSNYNARSMERDSESQIVIITENNDLKMKMKADLQNVLRDTSVIKGKGMYYDIINSLAIQLAKSFL